MSLFAFDLVACWGRRRGVGLSRSGDLVHGSMATFSPPLSHLHTQADKFDVYLKRLGVPFPESPKIRLEPKREGACLFMFMDACLAACICMNTEVHGVTEAVGWLGQ